MFNMLIKLQRTHWTIHGYERTRHNWKHPMEKSFRERQKKQEKTTLHHVKLVKHVNITELWHSKCGKEWFVARRFSHQYIFDIPHQQTPPIHCSFSACRHVWTDAVFCCISTKEKVYMKWSIAMDILSYDVSYFYIKLFLHGFIINMKYLHSHKIIFCSHHFIEYILLRSICPLICLKSSKEIQISV